MKGMKGEGRRDGREYRTCSRSHIFVALLHVSECMYYTVVVSN